MDGPWTRFLVGFVLLLSGTLSCLELAWFGAAAPRWALTIWVVAVALYGLGFLALGGWAGESLGCLNYVFVPPFLGAYLAGKVALYSLVLDQPIGPLTRLALLHAFACVLLVCVAAALNPTWENMTHAIEARWNWALEVMLWLRFRRDDSELGRLVNGALLADNAGAVRRLLRRGAGGYVDDWVRTARSREVEWLIVKAMLDRGPDPEPGRVGRYAACFGVKELRYCLGKGVDPMQIPQLMHAAIEEQTMETDTVSPEEHQSIIDKLQLLLDHGAEVEAPSYHLLPPLFTAIRLGVDMTPVVRFLLGRGARVDTRAVNPLYPPGRGPLPVGHTPLMLAVVTNRPEYAQALLEHGADPDLRDEDGKTARDYAAELPDGDAIKAMLTQATRK